AALRGEHRDHASIRDELTDERHVTRVRAEREKRGERRGDRDGESAEHAMRYGRYEHDVAGRPGSSRLQRLRSKQRTHAARPSHLSIEPMLPAPPRRGPPAILSERDRNGCCALPSGSLRLAVRRNGLRREGDAKAMTETPRNGSAHSRRHIASGIEAFLGRVVHATGVPGIAVEIRIGGRHISAAAGHTGRGGAPITAAHRFHAGCAIKLLLAVVALELAARGRLALDAPIGEPLPELAHTIHGRTVQVSNLLSHTSGYRGTHLLDPATRELDWPG